MFDIFSSPAQKHRLGDFDPETARRNVCLAKAVENTFGIVIAPELGRGGIDGDLADLKVKSYDVEAWSPRQKKYFEVGSCSNLGDAQARRLRIRVNGKDGKYFAHTLNNTVVAPPRMLIAFLENNLQADGSVRIPEVLQPYMGGMTEIR